MTLLDDPGLWTTLLDGIGRCSTLKTFPETCFRAFCCVPVLCDWKGETMRWDEEETCLDDETDCLNGDPMALNGDVTFSGDEEVANGEARRSCSEREGEDISRLEEELVEDESCVGFAGDTNGFLIPLGFGFEFALGGSELGTLEEDEGENAGGGELDWFAWACRASSSSEGVGDGKKSPGFCGEPSCELELERWTLIDLSLSSIPTASELLGFHPTEFVSESEEPGRALAARTLVLCLGLVVLVGPRLQPVLELAAPTPWVTGPCLTQSGLVICPCACIFLFGVNAFKSKSLVDVAMGEVRWWGWWCIARALGWERFALVVGLLVDIALW